MNIPSVRNLARFGLATSVLINYFFLFLLYLFSPFLFLHFRTLLEYETIYMPGSHRVNILFSSCHVSALTNYLSCASNARWTILRFTSLIFRTVFLDATSISIRVSVHAMFVKIRNYIWQAARVNLIWSCILVSPTLGASSLRRQRRDSGRAPRRRHALHPHPWQSQLHHYESQLHQLFGTQSYLENLNPVIESRPFMNPVCITAYDADVHYVHVQVDFHYTSISFFAESAPLLKTAREEGAMDVYLG